MLQRSSSFSASNRCPTASARLRLGVLAALGILCSAPALAGTGAPICDWTGGSSATSLWSDAANWNNCGGAHPVPVDGDIVRFLGGTPRLANQNDLVGLDLLQLVFTGPNYVLTGNGVTVNGLISSSVASVVSSDVGPDIGLPITLAGTTTLECNGNRDVRVSAPVATAAFPLLVQGSCNSELAAALSGSGLLRKAGPGALTVSASGSHSGPVLVEAGLLVLRADPGSATFDVASGGSLRVETDTTFGGALTLSGAGAPGVGTLAAFNGLPNWAGPITLSNGATVEVDGSAILTLSGAVAGSGGLSKTGVGQLVLSGSSSSYTGGTTLLTGDVLATNNGALGASGFPVLVSQNTMLELEADVYANRPLVLNGAGLLGVGALRSRGADVVWSGPVALASDVGIGGQLNTSLTLSGVVSGPGTLNHVGLNELVLSAANTYTGLTQVSNGALVIRNAEALGSAAAGTVLVSNASLAVDGPLVVGEPLALNGGFGFGGAALRMLDGDNAWSAPITLGSNTSIDPGPGTLSVPQLDGSGGFQKIGSGTLVLTGSNNYSGQTLVVDGVLRLEHGDALGSGGAAAAGVEVFNGATLQLAGVAVLDESLVLNGPGSGGLGALHSVSGSNSWAGPVTLQGFQNSVEVATGSQLVLGGAIGGSGTLTKAGTGTLTLSGANTYGGATQVDAGVLRLQSSTALGSASGASNTVNEAATLELEGGITIASEQLTLNGTGMVGATLRSLGGNNTWTGSLAGSTATVDVAAGTLSLVGGSACCSRSKAGPGTLILSGSQMFEGGWSLYAGTLQLEGVTTGNVITYDDSILTGNGTVGFLTAQDGTIAPQGTLNASYLVWYPAAELAFRLGPTAAGSDQLNLFGSLWRTSDPGDLHIRFDDAPAGPPTPFELYTLVNFPSGPFFPVGGTNFTVDALSHSYRGVPGNHGLNGMFELTSTQLQFVPITVSLFRDDFEGQP